MLYFYFLLFEVGGERVQTPQFMMKSVMKLLIDYVCNPHLLNAFFNFKYLQNCLSKKLWKKSLKFEEKVP